MLWRAAWVLRIVDGDIHVVPEAVEIVDVAEALELVPEALALVVRLVEHDAARPRDSGLGDGLGHVLVL